MTATSPRVPRAYSGAALVRVILLAGVVPLVIAGIGVLLMLRWAPELPDPIAVHWGAGGQVDGYGQLSTLVIVLPVVVGTFAVGITLEVALLTATTYPARQPKVIVAASVFFAVFLGVGLTGSVEIQRGLADASEAGTVFGPLGLGLLLGIPAAVGTWFLTPRPALAADESGPAAPAALDLSAAERVSWTRVMHPSAVAVWIFLGVVALSMAGVLTVAVTGSNGSVWPPLAILVPVVAICTVTFFWRVTISNEGVRIRSAVGLIRHTIPLDTIAAARVVQISPIADFGGWGIRFGFGRIGYVMRGGQALEIERTTGRSVVVTVDDAVTATSLLEGLLSRRKAA
jgi:hypothetical protein